MDKVSNSLIMDAYKSHELIRYESFSELSKFVTKEYEYTLGKLAHYVNQYRYHEKMDNMSYIARNHPTIFVQMKHNLETYDYTLDLIGNFDHILRGMLGYGFCSSNTSTVTSIITALKNQCYNERNYLEELIKKYGNEQ